MSDDENDDDESQLQRHEQRREPLPARYTADGKAARWEMLWLDRSGRGQHVDDDGADGSQKVDGVLPPLPDDMREESKRHGVGGPDVGDRHQQQKQQQQLQQSHR